MRNVTLKLVMIITTDIEELCKYQFNSWGKVAILPLNKQTNKVSNILMFQNYQNFQLDAIYYTAYHFKR